jgi:hypothetical protein
MATVGEPVIERLAAHEDRAAMIDRCAAMPAAAALVAAKRRSIRFIIVRAVPVWPVIALGIPIRSFIAIGIVEVGTIGRHHNAGRDDQHAKRCREADKHMPRRRARNCGKSHWISRSTSVMFHHAHEVLRVECANKPPATKKLRYLPLIHILPDRQGTDPQALKNEQYFVTLDKLACLLDRFSWVVGVVIGDVVHPGTHT